MEVGDASSATAPKEMNFIEVTLNWTTGPKNGSSRWDETFPNIVELVMRRESSADSRPKLPAYWILSSNTAEGNRSKAERAHTSVPRRLKSLLTIYWSRILLR
jgi:hypothetical protein